MYRLALKLVGIVVAAAVVWWRLEGKPLPGFLGGDDASETSGLVYTADGEIDMSQVYGTTVDAPADAAAIVFSQIGTILEQTERAAETARLRQERGCSFSTLPDMSDCPEPTTTPGPAAVPAPAPQGQPMPAVVSGRGGGAATAPGGVVVVRPGH